MLIWGYDRPDGRWLLRGATGPIMVGRFGDPIILLPRERLIDALLTRVPARVLALSTEVTSVEAGGRVVTTAGEMRADLALALGKLASAAPLRGLASVYDWHPPAIPRLWTATLRLRPRATMNSYDHENLFYNVN